MSEPDPDPAATESGPAQSSPRARRWPDLVISITPIYAAIALVLIAAGAIVLAVPVQNPGVQDCGAPAVFVLTGRPDVYVDEQNPPDGLTPAEARAANADRCQERVAARAVPGGILLAVGLVVGLAAAVVEWLARIARRRDQLQLAIAGQAGSPRAPTLQGPS